VDRDLDLYHFITMDFVRGVYIVFIFYIFLCSCHAKHSTWQKVITISNVSKETLQSIMWTVVSQ